MYGCETRVIMMNWEAENLKIIERKIFGPMRDNGQYRRTNQELENLARNSTQ